MDKSKQNAKEMSSNEIVFSIDEFTPEIFDCEADGSCGNGHLHNNT